jgi:hypothetical protein
VKSIGLKLDDDPVFNEQVDATAAVDSHIAITDVQAVLTLDPKPTPGKFELQPGLASGFEQTRGPTFDGRGSRLQ